ncbi:MAG: hypothetical protein ONB23_05415 [candidate division KSB1 bacterium]|nr:hypothetical protein [candidate division KSB1 bacterium]
MIVLATATAHVAAQTPEEYLPFFHSVLKTPERYDSSVVLREFDRCEFAFVQSPRLGEVLVLRARYLARLGRCAEAAISAAKGAAVFQVGREEISSVLQTCRPQLSPQLWSRLEPLFGLRTEGFAQPARARRFVLALLSQGLTEAEAAVRREVEWYLSWFPQPVGADSVRSAYADYLARAGRRNEALAEYLSVLELFAGSKLIPEVGGKAFRLAREMGEQMAARRAVELLEQSLRVRRLSDAEVRALLLALSRMYLELGESEGKGLQTFAWLADQFRTSAIPAELLWEYGRRFASAGDTARALLCLRLLQDRYPRHPIARQARTLQAGLEQGLRGQLEAAFPRPPARGPRFADVLTKADHEAIKKALLARINQDRQKHGLRPLVLDSLASAVADSHCAEALHWGYAGYLDLRGLKPHQRYALAGGYHACTEDFLTAAWTAFRATPQRVAEMVLRSHERLLQAQAPNDAYRRNVLAPEHNRCGIGLAVGPNGYRLSILWLDAYVLLDPLPPMLFSTQAAPRDTVWVTGSVVKGATLVTAALGVEPWPRPLRPEEIRGDSPYSIPEFYTALVETEALPSEGGEEPKSLWYWRPWSDFHFRFTEDKRTFCVPVVFHRGGPAVYTLAVWVKREDLPRPFPATYLCFFVR